MEKGKEKIKTERKQNERRMKTGQKQNENRPTTGRNRLHNNMILIMAYCQSLGTEFAVIKG